MFCIFGAWPWRSCWRAPAALPGRYVMGASTRTRTEPDRDPVISYPR